ncbi:hypothetical protein BDV25DRAFT_138659 [Aspergillus avenaceus]|uniref:Uncharacterized protein n=1 Tax=Aspergillus avenaceus TaxID=36643 RepID=A0A5N6U052_ASPAV|nr:hypothetical protein BDV25DRAFT_138659 [Aspergillus avenaceus]
MHSEEVVESTSSVVSSVSRVQHSIGLLDSILDEINVPALVPQAAQRAEGPSTGNSITETSAELPLKESTALLDTVLENLGIPTLEPERKKVIAPRVPQVSMDSLSRIGKHLKTAWDGKIRWAIIGPSVFDNEEDELDAFYFRPNHFSSQPIRDFWMFQYGLRYVPTKYEKNAYRTIRIEQVPSTMTLAHILPAISGEIYSAYLGDTRPITGDKTAIVVFVRQSDALLSLQNSKSGLRLGSNLAKVVPVNTPTYPMPADLEKLIVEEGYTRSLLVSSSRRTIKSEVCRVMGKCAYASHVEAVEDGPVLGEVSVRFNSIKVAAAAYGTLKNHPSFGQCHFRFLRNDQNTRGALSQEKNIGNNMQEARSRVGIWD